MDALRRVLEMLEAQALPWSLGVGSEGQADPLVVEGLGRIAAALTLAIAEHGKGTAGMCFWSYRQLERVVDLLHAFVSAVKGLRADGGEIQIVQKILECTIQLSVLGLEWAFFVDTSCSDSPFADEKVQQRLLHLLELVVLDASSQQHELCSRINLTANSMSELPFDLSSPLEDVYNFDLPRSVEVGSSGCGNTEVLVSKNILAILGSEDMLFNELRNGSSETQGDDASLKQSTSLGLAARYFVLSEERYIERLVGLCKEGLSMIVRLGLGEEKAFQGLSLITNILKFLADMSRKCSYCVFEKDAIKKLVEVICTLSDILKLKLTREIGSLESDDAFERSQGSMMALFDAVLALLEMLSSPDGTLLQNARTYFAASILDNMDGAIIKQDASELIPLACTSQMVVYFLRLIQGDGSPGNVDHVVNTGQHDLDDVNDSSYLCTFRSGKFDLKKRRSYLEHMQVVFNTDGHWLDNLLSSAYVLFHQGLSPHSMVDMPVQNDEESITPDVATMAGEDDALFGDLFSESGRHSSHSEESIPSCTKRMDGLYNSPLQAACQVMKFLKDCIFFSEWNKPIYSIACHFLCKEHVDVLLQLHFLQSADISGTTHQPIDAELGSDLLQQLQKLSFEILDALVVRGILSDSLEIHICNQILKGGEMPYGILESTLVLVAKILIDRSNHQISNDPLVFDLWRGFLSSLANRSVKVAKLNETSSHIILPSWFQMEVLFMAFHSLDTSGRLSLVERVVSLLASSNADKQISGTQITVWALHTSRLILSLKYMLLYFDAIPRWLLADLAKALGLVKMSHKMPVESSFLSSSAALAYKVLERSHVVGQHDVDEHIFQQLLDVNCSINTSANGGFLGTVHSYQKLRFVLRDVLDVWSNRAIKSFAELICERYMFLLCWSILETCALDMESAVRAQLAASEECHLLDIFFIVGKCLYVGAQQQSIALVEDWSTYLTRCLGFLKNGFVSGNPNMNSWLVIRQGAVLTLVLSVLQSGTQSLLTDVGTDREGSIGCKKGDLTFFGEVMLHIVEHDVVDSVLEVLSSILDWYIGSLHTLASDIMTQLCETETALSAVLVLHSFLDSEKKLGILGKVGLHLPTLKLIFRWGLHSWKNDAVYMNMDSDSNVVVPALLHGFPTCSHPSSAEIASCFLSLENIIDSIAKCISAYAVVKGKRLSMADANVLENLTLVTVRMSADSVFESVHAKCKTLMDCLITSKEEQGVYIDLYFLKHIKDTLARLSKDSNVLQDVREAIIIQAVEEISSLRTNPNRCEALRLCFGNGEPWKSSIVCRHLSGQGDPSYVVNVLQGCLNETINIKCLQLMIDILDSPIDFHFGFMHNICVKFLEMDSATLAAWLEERLLGSVTTAKSGVHDDTGKSAVHDLAATFIQMLVSPQDSIGKDMRSHVVEAMLLGLNHAFSFYDVGSATSYFNLVVRLAIGEPYLKLVLQTVVDLLDELPTDSEHLEGIKHLLMFLNSVFKTCGMQNAKMQRTLADSIKCATTCINVYSGLASIKSKHPLQAVSESEGPPVECDATSVDEDEDDGTSDGDVGSIDREEEDDGSSSEKALASQVCTFTSSGSNFMEQHWYFCYTCELTVSKGCCSICAKVCHRGHKVVYSRLSRFFCDCGAGGVRGSSCLCLKPRKYVPAANKVTKSVPVTTEPFLSLVAQDVQLSECDSEADDNDLNEGQDLFKIFLGDGEENHLLAFLCNLDVEGRLLSLGQRLLANLTLETKGPVQYEEIILGKDKLLNPKADILQLKRAYKSGSLDMKIKADYPNARELKSQLLSGSLVKSLLTISSRGRLAAGEGDKVTLFDVGQLIGQPTATPVTVDKTTVKPLSKNSVRFELVHLAFNAANENYLAVAGYEDCQVFTVNSRGEVTDRLAVELALQDAYIRHVFWVPGSQVELLIVTNRFVKIFDLSQDRISPSYCLTVLEDTIIDACIVPLGHGRMLVVILSQQGVLYRQQLGGRGDSGACIMTETIQFPEQYKPVKGISLHFSYAHRLMFLSMNDGTTWIARLDLNNMTLSEVSSLFEVDQDGKTRPAAFHHWRDLFDGSGLFMCLCSQAQRANSAVVMHIGADTVYDQHLRGGSNLSCLRVDGVTAYKPITKEKGSVLILYEDGSLHIFSYAPSVKESGSISSCLDSSRTTSNLEIDHAKKLGAVLLSSRANTGPGPVFPVDFFEKTICITSDVKLGGDILRNTDSDGVKHSLASEDGFIESPSPLGFKILVFNSNPDLVMVGCRVHVGNTPASHIPSEVRLFQRFVKLEEGVRSWYDIPFTNSESLLSDEEFALCIGPTFNGSALPRIDSLEIYARSKDEFGWKEKLDAVLDMENQQGISSSLVAGSGTSKVKKVQNASMQEQVLYENFKLLSEFYIICKGQSIATVDETQNTKCLSVLEKIFESDRYPLLQSAAKYVLHSLFPNRDAYYQVKDMMCLSGVARSYPSVASKLMLGGACMTGIIQDFTSQVRTVCKVALHRPSNLANFLEREDASIIEGLIDVLWDMLGRDGLEPQVINGLVVLTVDLLYGYAECLSIHAESTGSVVSVTPAICLVRKLLFAPYEAVRSSCSLALSSRLLQVPLPKQKMLAMDDVADTGRTMSTSADNPATTTPSGQIMLDEDPSTASVQYCCDGCSTVPILRRRWHCNVCPDFDLCETCYEVMDVDQLPPPHSSDHPMLAITIEADTSVETNEMQFSSIDEMSDESLLQMATELSLHPSSGSALETIQSCDYAENLGAIECPTPSASASKSVLGSEILKRLAEEIQGWAKCSTGAEAVPIMQLFYRIASAGSGPLVDAHSDFNLEKLIKMLLDELNLGVPPLIKVRTHFGEVLILIFMFFTSLLRHWHQPGTEHTLRPTGAADAVTDSQVQVDCQSSGVQVTQLYQACMVLRQQSLVSYLLNIAHQLMHVFKSPRQDSSSATSSGCGALLTVRKEFAAGSFTPFFSDSYAKAHKGDLFADFHRLLAENVFRLAYSLVRPGKPDKSTDKDQMSSKSCYGSDLNLDGWQEVLCSYINNPHTSFVRKYARRLLLHVCGSKTHYYNVRDSWQLNKEVKKLYKLIQKSGGFHSSFPYDRNVKILKCLSLIADAASARPRNWQKYCLRHIEVVQFLLSGIFCFAEELVVQTLKLLSLMLYSGKELGSSLSRKDSEVSSASSKPHELEKKERRIDEGYGLNEKACLDMEQAVQQFAADSWKVLKDFVNIFLLEWNATAVRSEAKTVLYGAWHHGGQTFRMQMLSLLLEKVSALPAYGQNVVEFKDILSWLLGKGIRESAINSHEMQLVQSCLTANTVRKVFETLRLQNELLANHPNSRIYSTLANLVEFDGYYLESEPCLACSSPEVPYARMKLESIKAETKFTDNRILVKCVGSYTIQSVTMNVHDARKSKSVKVLNLYYNNRMVSDLAELKNNRSLWKRAKSCPLGINQTELKVEFPIPITACNFMIELDSFYENLQAASLESLQCPRCSRYVTDKHGICANCHENAYQCRQCRNINYENLDSFLCNECGYSKYGRFEFNFMAKPSFMFDSMENDDDMKKGLSAIETESENAHRRYQQLLGYKKPLLKLVSSIGEIEMDSQQKDSVQQMIVSLPGSSSFKINRKIAILGVLYGEKCKMAFDSVSKSVQTLQGLRRVLMLYLEKKRSPGASTVMTFAQRHPNRCFGCANTFVGHCLEWLQILVKLPRCKQQLVTAGILRELFENNIHQGPKSARTQARAALSAFTEGDSAAVAELNNLIKSKVLYCLEHHRSIDIAACIRDELQLLSETCSLGDDFWEARLRVVFQLLFRSIQVGARHPVIAEHIILPCLRIVSQACTPPKSEHNTEESVNVAAALQHEMRANDQTKNAPVAQLPVDIPMKAQPNLSEREAELQAPELFLVNYVEWRNGATYLDFIRRQYTISEGMKPFLQKSRRDSRRLDSLALKYLLRWKRRACKLSLTDELKAFEEISWVRELVLSACSQAIRSEMCGLIDVLCSQSAARRSKFLNLLMNLLPATKSAGESAAEYFDLLFRMVEPEDSRLYLTVRGFLRTSCSLISEEVICIEAQERSFQTDISQGYILHKLIELVAKFLEVATIRSRFVKEELLAQLLEALLVIRGLVVQKTKLISDCGRLLRNLLDDLLQESDENKGHFIRACVSRLQLHQGRKDRTSLYILEQLCNIICRTKPETAYMMVLNKAHTQEEFIRGSMTKNPYSSLEVGPLMRDVKNKICQQLELLGFLEDDYGMELLVAGNIISLDLSVAQVYEQVWRKAHVQAATSAVGTSLLSPRDCPPMTITYRLQGLDGEATEPMIKELDDDREESQDPEIEFAIAGVLRECDGLQILLQLVQVHLQQLANDELGSAQEELALVLKLLINCCKIRANRQALLRLGALGVLLETAQRALSTDAAQPMEGLLLIVECLVTEANESDFGVAESALSLARPGAGAGEQAASAVLMFLERLSHPSILKQSKKHRNNDTVARILPYLTYGERAAMEVLVDHFLPYLQNWDAFDQLQKQHQEDPGDSMVSQKAGEHHLALDNFVRVTESIKLNLNGERLKDLIMEKNITTGAIQHLKNAFPVVERGLDYKASPLWMRGLEKPSVPIILSVLRGLSRGHIPTQQCLDKEDVLPLLHALEGVSGESEIGAKAENVLDAISDKDGVCEGSLADKVLTLRHTTRDEMRRRALQRREELLQALGMSMKSDGGKRIIVGNIEGLEDVEEEETGLACMVCREGYKLRPQDMLGTYCFCKRINLGSGSVGPNARAEWVYTTVSHFNVIHFQCHQEAKRADSALKNPKKEWEGAALRNSETLCNNIFPLRGPAVPQAQYAKCVDLYWDNLNALGRADGSRIRLLAYDIVLMLGRFATSASFNTDCKGGGKESNSRLLPFMVQMARYLVDQQGSGQHRNHVKALTNYLCPSVEGSDLSKPSTPSTPQRSGAHEESVQFMMVLSLLLHSFDDWQNHRCTFLQRSLYHSFMVCKLGKAALPVSPPGSTVSPNKSSGDLSAVYASPTRADEPKQDVTTEGVESSKLFEIIHPMLVFVGLVDQLQRFFKTGVLKSRDANKKGTSESQKDELPGIEPWERIMKERAHDVCSMLTFSKDMLQWLDEMQNAEDIQEAFDIMGTLADVFKAGFSSCESFVRSAIRAESR